MNLSGIDEAVMLAERRWPGLTLKVRRNEANGPCPICGKATKDGFIVFEDGGYLCRPGNHTGWLDENEEREKLSPEERRLRKIEADAAKLKRKVEALEKRQTVLEQMMKSQDHVKYHGLVGLVEEYWHGEGINDASIKEYMLGFCDRCPTDAAGRPSYTIPIFDSSWSRLYNIRHRIVGAEGGDKYRPHMTGLGRFLFNARWTLEHDEVLLVEGEKKSIVLSQEVMPTIGICGANGFNLEWLPHMKAVRKLYVGLDPDVYQTGLALGERIKKARPRWDVRVVVH